MNKTNTFRIWIAGDYDEARKIIRRHCFDVGDCFSVLRTDFIYSGGEETGVCVTRINYGRFPADYEEIKQRVNDLAKKLCAGLCQKSYTVETPIETIYVTEIMPFE